MNLDELLASREVRFEKLHHRPAFTANRIAQMLHVPGKDMAKTVLLRVGKGFVLSVLPATCKVDLERVRDRLGEEDVRLATEEEIQQAFPDCEVGAIPPFGSQYRVHTLVDELLAEDDEIIFEGQSHEDAFRLAYRDFEQIEQPMTGRFAVRM